MRVHDVFNVDRLKQYQPNEAKFASRPIPKATPVVLDESTGEEMYIVEKLLKKRQFNRKLEVVFLANATMHALSLIVLPRPLEMTEGKPHLDGRARASTERPTVRGAEQIEHRIDYTMSDTEAKPSSRKSRSPEREDDPVRQAP
ncbi:hypothetical protein H257_05512 [Aphanomyces astaci]|uniref:Uncharacterized protein n=1 Tax=Aphanomyces astaci TaxID=112090 RepID=W4GQG6_APHAT|nr:hypothetical protein H257_05512 [Aphanomyces astaci]ETV81985.1 hypothetical protein H257_05512 [Aphanomyces astaci]|eukprot:XP_009828722.1 hypothetical protein H257_05512 [Aphanomyces astaci]